VKKDGRKMGKNDGKQRQIWLKEGSPRRHGGRREKNKISSPCPPCLRGAFFFMSCPDLIRASIHHRTGGWMDCRVEPGNDEEKSARQSG
jgi:hypothetical protein